MFWYDFPCFEVGFWGWFFNHKFENILPLFLQIDFYLTSFFWYSNYIYVWLLKIFLKITEFLFTFFHPFYQCLSMVITVLSLLTELIGVHFSDNSLLSGSLPHKFKPPETLCIHISVLFNWIRLQAFPCFSSLHCGLESVSRNNS